MWNLKIKTIKKQKQTNEYRKQISGYQSKRGEVVVVMDGNQTYGGDHSLVYTDVDARLYTWNLYNKKKNIAHQVLGL